MRGGARSKWRNCHKKEEGKKRAIPVEVRRKRSSLGPREGAVHRLSGVSSKRGKKEKKRKTPKPTGYPLQTT